MKQITWLTSASFLDVDIDVVPALTSYYHIKWIIWGKPNQADEQRVKTHMNDSDLEIRFISFRNKWFSPLIFFEYRKHLIDIQKDCDLFYVDCGGGLSFYQALDSCTNKQKTILAIHNVKTPKGARLETLAKINTWYAIHRFHNIHNFSKNQKNYLEARVSGKNILQAPLMLKNYGVATEKRNDSITNFLTFGHIRGYKRVDLLINAAEELYLKGYRNFKVTIAGNCKTWSSYQNLIRHPELFDLHIGFIENDDIPNYFAKADYFVLPYQDLAQSGAITVAFCYNVPVITSDIEQFMEFNNDDNIGFRFKSCDSHELALTMELALNRSDEDREGMRKAQREYVEIEFSAASILNRYKEYFDCLISKCHN